LVTRSAQHVGQHGQRKFDDKQQDQPVQQAATEPQPQRFGLVRRLHQQHDIVDDQFADIQGDDRHDRANQPQQQRRRHQFAAGVPNHGQEGAQVLQRPDAFPERSAGRRGRPETRRAGGPPGVPTAIAVLPRH
jgi:hypothetical protein